MELAHTVRGVHTHAGVSPHSVRERCGKALQDGGQAVAWNIEDYENSIFTPYLPYHFEGLCIKAAKKNILSNRWFA